MRLLIVHPDLPPASGNLVTARRLATGLAQRGHEVQLLPTREGEIHQLPAPRADAALLLHARRSGRPWLATPDAAAIPYAVLLTGTDVNHDLHDSQRTNDVRRCLDNAAAILTHNPLTLEQLQAEYPAWRARCRLLPQGIELGDQPWELRRRHQLPPDKAILLHPAGIRPVKGQLPLLQLCVRLAAQRDDFILAFCGPVLDATYAAALNEAIFAMPWAHYLGIIPPEAMPAALRGATLVLNHSESEGLPQALVEAACVGTPILARDIPGNRAVVRPGENGLLYGDDDTFVRLASNLLDHPEVRCALSHPEPERFDLQRESLVLDGILNGVVQYRWGSSLERKTPPDVNQGEFCGD